MTTVSSPNSDPIALLSEAVYADILLDMPGCYTLARVVHPVHTVYEMTFVPENCDEEDHRDMLEALPVGCVLFAADILELEGFAAVQTRYICHDTEFGLTASETRAARLEMEDALALAETFVGRTRLANIRAFIMAVIANIFGFLYLLTAL